jgi:hypothetical protein
MIRLLANAVLSKKDRFDSFITGAASIICLTILNRVVGGLGKLQEVRDDISSIFLTVLRCFPSIRARVDEEKKKARESIEVSLLADAPSTGSSLPEEGMTEDALTSILKSKAVAEEAFWKGGNLTGAIYSTDEKLLRLHGVALTEFSKSNLLHPDVLKAYRKM